MMEERINTHLIRERITGGVRLVFVMQRVVGNPNWTPETTDGEIEVAGICGKVRRLSRTLLYKDHWASPGGVLELHWVLQVPMDSVVPLFDGRGSGMRRRAAA